MLQRSGVDTASSDFQRSFGALDVTDGSRFLGGLAASAIVIVSASAAQRELASTVVVAVASAGGRELASTVVVAVASAGGRELASTVVVAVASAGGRELASTVVIVAASAGQREMQPNQPITVTIPPAMKMAEVAGALRELASQLEAESVALDEQVNSLTQHLKDAGVAQSVEDSSYTDKDN
jgi:hypothetical protein